MSPAEIALNRFGLGARISDAPPADPRRYLLDQFDRFEPWPAAFAGLKPRREIAGQFADYFQKIRTSRRGRRDPEKMMSDMESAEGREFQRELRGFIRRAARSGYMAGVGARAASAVETEAPFAERLVHFWANHFAVSADKLPIIGLAGYLEFEAVRPHMTGNFADMLLAVEQHPAMLLYLDQAQSVGPNSRAGQLAKRFRRRAGRKIGLNENLAREILELHTLGVDGGYDQNDVVELARAITGWSVSGITRGPMARFVGLSGEPRNFAFAPMIHEPGARKLLGRRYEEGGQRQGEAILRDLARHPATAAHIATKLARHFAGDPPPRALIARLEAAFLSSGGDLPTVYRALVESPEPWAERPLKFKSPWDWTVSALRGFEVDDIRPRMLTGMLAQLGQPVWRPGSPAGYEDNDARWLGPDGLIRRAEVAERLGAAGGARVDARIAARKLFPGGLGEHSELQISRAESPAQALALLLVCPEFMRR